MMVTGRRVGWTQWTLHVVGVALLSVATFELIGGDLQRGLTLTTLAGVVTCLRVLDRLETEINELRREFGERKGQG